MALSIPMTKDNVIKPSSNYTTVTMFFDEKSLALTKLKEFADDKSTVAKMIISVFDGVLAFSPFPTMFSKAFII